MYRYRTVGRKPDKPRCDVFQGDSNTRDAQLGDPSEISNEEGSGRVGTDHMERCFGRDCQQDEGDKDNVRARFNHVHRVCQSNKRRVLSVQEVCSVQRYEQRRPPGEDMPFYNCCGHGEHVELWRDDKLVERYAQLGIDLLLR